MFPYPSGAGLHVGHPEGYTATDILRPLPAHERLQRPAPMGWDAFGLPAEQYAIKTGQHPRVTTEKNIATFRRQIAMLGLGYDWDREVDTTDPLLPKWTQWIFLQIFNTWFDPSEPGPAHRRAVDEPIAGSERGTDDGRPWAELSRPSAVASTHRLAYEAEVPVNWCPALGTVLANEEVTSTAQRGGGNSPCRMRPLRQWMLRITAYADRLLEDLDLVDWPDAIKKMQRDWIGRARARTSTFPVRRPTATEIEVFTTRPDTLFGATYMVLAPEHPLVERDHRRSTAAGRAAGNQRGRRRLRAPGRAKSESSARRAPREDRRVHRAPTRSTRSTASRSRSGSPTTC